MIRDKLHAMTDRELIGEAARIADMAPTFAPWLEELAHRIDRLANDRQGTTRVTGSVPGGSGEQRIPQTE